MTMIVSVVLVLFLLFLSDMNVGTQKSRTLQVGLRSRLDHIYTRFNSPCFVEPDPLQFVRDFKGKADQEIIGVIAALLAYGRVSQINKSVDTVVGIMSQRPYDYILTTRDQQIARDFSSFSYRFTKPEHMLELIRGIRRVVRTFGSLEQCFLKGYHPGDDSTIPGLIYLMDHITRDCSYGHLCADPSKKSACKRHHLFLRWMIRKDEVDPGPWQGIDRSKLLIPLDTHMFAIGTLLGFTRRKSADITTALEITRGFRAINAEDPVKYDFSLTRFGIRNQMNLTQLKEALI